MRAVVLDTDVFSALFVTPRERERAVRPVDLWRMQLAGMRVTISFQTRVELLVGARSGNWGVKRLNNLNDRIAATPVIGLDEAVLRAYVGLTSDCKAAGHALHSKIHTADRWVASCAIAHGVPLLSGDKIYADATGLDLLGS